MKGVDSCERCGDRLPFEKNRPDVIKAGETVIKVETHPDTNNNMIKTTELYHVQCYIEKLKEEMRTEELEQEVREELREELRDEVKQEMEEEDQGSLDEL